MSNPRHLWSGDWELDSAAAREELAKRRGQVDEPAEPPPAVSPPPARPSATARATAWLRELTAGLRRLRVPGLGGAAAALSRRSRRLRIALLVVLVGVVSASVAYGITTLLVDSGSASASGPRAYLGVDVVGSPFGILVTYVAPGSPADKAGLLPGDTLTAINSQPLNKVDDVHVALGHLHAGQTVPVAFTRALTPYTTAAHLVARPKGYP